MNQSEATLKALEALGTYRIVDQRTIQEMQSRGIVLEHKKTKAKVFLISNDDDNKVFFIGFRTPPDDDTGLHHILQHRVLCRSRQSP